MCQKKYKVRLFFASIIRFLRRKKFILRGYNFSDGVIIESGVILDKIHPQGITIGENSLIARGAVILSHDHVYRSENNGPKLYNTVIGRNVFIGINTIILPGVEIGDNVVIGSGSVVTKDIKGNSIAVGNPARIIKDNISIGSQGIINNRKND